MSIRNELAKKFVLSKDDTEIYMDVVQKLLDNLMQMGLPVRLNGILEIKYNYKDATRYAVIGRNKRKIRSILNGNDKTTYICGNLNQKKVKHAGSEISKKRSTGKDKRIKNGNIGSGSHDVRSDSKQLSTVKPRTYG